MEIKSKKTGIETKVMAGLGILCAGLIGFGFLSGGIKVEVEKTPSETSFDNHNVNLVINNR